MKSPGAALFNRTGKGKVYVKWEKSGGKIAWLI